MPFINVLRLSTSFIDTKKKDIVNIFSVISFVSGWRIDSKHYVSGYNSWTWFHNVGYLGKTYLA